MRTYLYFFVGMNLWIIGYGPHGILSGTFVWVDGLDVWISGICITGKNGEVIIAQVVFIH